MADLHLQISSGAASKKTEEQIWEQQRIVTQLKRNLRNAKKGLSLESEEGQKPKYEPIDYEEELDFSLRVPSRAEDTIRDELSLRHKTNLFSRNFCNYFIFEFLIECDNFCILRL